MELSDVRTFLADEHGLAVVSTVQSDGRVLSSIANCGVIEDPTTGETAVGLVSLGSAARLGHIRRGSEVTLAIRREWRWVGVTGPANLVGPDDPAEGVGPDQLATLLRDVFKAAGGSHDDWDEYDRAMAEERRTCIFVKLDRIIGN